MLSPCGRIVKLIDVWEQVPEALQLRGFQAFRFDRQAIYSCLHTGVHRPLHTGVHDVCTRVCMIGVCVSHNTFLFMRAVSLFFEQMPSCAVVPVQGDSPAGKNDCLENTVLVAIFP